MRPCCFLLGSWRLPPYSCRLTFHKHFQLVRNCTSSNCLYRRAFVASTVAKQVNPEEDIDPSEQTTSFRVTPDEVGQRVDKLLALRFPQQSRTYFEKLIEKRLVRLNGSNAVTKGFRTRLGDEVEVTFLVSPEFHFEPQNIPLNILYEDEHILVINKASNMVVHPAPGNWNNTLVNALAYHLGVHSIENSHENMRPWIVHRLDKGTSGVLVTAKTDLAQRNLMEAFKSRTVQKSYIAVCYGNPMTRLHVLSGNNIIDLPIGRSHSNRLKMEVVPLEKGGKEAITVVEGVAFNEQRLCVVSLKLLTGRTHQIRVHLRHCASYILGDELYGLEHMNEKYKHLTTRPLLHSYKLAFPHPITGEWQEFRAPLPADLKAAVNYIRK
ncbi:hypothetical protein GAYE_SCF43G5630 [Galdieria yellowstonensis]|uniref:Pseudouridine synthase n=1 Tax=Galdieria yellowstonensis TaxID=3028027 RepID=A0AAV9IK39_9RHOD|nr:hypothetical protein GAYE_SCF43G5630 [Galdieria yellowstonensis]